MRKKSNRFSILSFTATTLLLVGVIAAVFYLTEESSGEKLSAQASLGPQSRGGRLIDTTDRSPIFLNIQDSQKFVASKNGSKYYPIDCTAANRIKEENRIYFTNEKEAGESGLEISNQCSDE